MKIKDDDKTILNLMNKNIIGLPEQIKLFNCCDNNKLKMLSNLP